MTFEQDYNKIIGIVTKKLRDNRVNMIEPTDIIGDAYLKFTELNTSYSITSFLNICNSIIFGSKTIFEITDKNGVSPPRIRWKGGDHKACKDCKNVMPIEMFRSITLKHANNIQIKCSYCKKCQNKRSKKNEKKQSINLSDSYIIKTMLHRKSNIWSKQFILERPRLIEIERNILKRKRMKRLKAA